MAKSALIRSKTESKKRGLRTEEKYILGRAKLAERMTKKIWGGRRTNLQASPMVGQSGDRVKAMKEAAKVVGLERIGETIKRKKKKK